MIIETALQKYLDHVMKTITVEEIYVGDQDRIQAFLLEIPQGVGTTVMYRPSVKAPKDVILGFDKLIKLKRTQDLTTAAARNKAANILKYLTEKLNAFGLSLSDDVIEEVKSITKTFIAGKKDLTHFEYYKQMLELTGGVDIGLWNPDLYVCDANDVTRTDKWPKADVGSGRWLVHVRNKDGVLFAPSPSYKTKEGAYGDAFSIVKPIHKADPAREGKGAPIHKDLGWGVFTALVYLVNEALIIDDTIEFNKYTREDGMVIQISRSCDTCAYHNRIENSYNGDEPDDLTLPSRTLLDKRLTGEMNCVDICSMQLIHQFENYVKLYNEAAAKDREWAITDCDDKSYKVGLKSAGQDRIAYKGKNMDWKQFREQIAKDVANDCIYYRLSMVNQKVPGVFYNAKVDKDRVCLFTEIVVGDRPTWVDGLPGDNPHQRYTGRIGINSGLGIMLVTDEKFFGVFKDRKVAYRSQVDRACDALFDNIMTMADDYVVDPENVEGSKEELYNRLLLYIAENGTIMEANNILAELAEQLVLTK